MSKNGHIHVLSASIRGSLHKSLGLPCQDYSCARSAKNKLVAVVSDGAGSAKHSKIGAQIICNTLCDLLIKSNLETIKEDVVHAINVARKKLILHRYNHSKSPADLVNFSATLVGVFYYKNKGVFSIFETVRELLFKKKNMKILLFPSQKMELFPVKLIFTPWMIGKIVCALRILKMPIVSC